MKISNVEIFALAALGGFLLMGKTRSMPVSRFDDEFTAAEARYNIPHNLLKKIGWRESRFREDIISGETKSRAGAIGLMQIVPKWHPLADPYNPSASIVYAAHYLQQLYNQFGDWKLAVMAYNWGPGNVNGWLASGKHDSEVPAETRGYIEEVFG